PVLPHGRARLAAGRAGGRGSHGVRGRRPAVAPGAGDAHGAGPAVAGRRGARPTSTPVAAPAVPGALAAAATGRSGRRPTPAHRRAGSGFVGWYAAAGRNAGRAG